MGDREDELRRAIARKRLAGGVLAAMSAEKAARAGLFEEGNGEQLRLRRRLLADRARYPVKIARAEDKAKRIRAERDAAKAAAGRGKLGGGREEGPGWAGPARTRRRRPYMIRQTSAITDLPWARQPVMHAGRWARRSMDLRPSLIWPNILRIRTMKLRAL